MKKIVFLIAALTVLAGCCCKSADAISVVPYPQSVKIQAGVCNLAGAAVRADEALGEAACAYAATFAEDLAKASGKDGKAVIEFVPDANLAPEAYTLAVNAKGVTIAASGLNGVVYGVQTLKQLLPVCIYTGEACPDADWNVKHMKIADAPRFAYRGMHLDPCRHFFDVNEVKRYIDIMEIHKLNTLHFHLTEDQGWRVEIKKYPKLTEIGSRRTQTIIAHTKKYDGVPYGGYYTQDDIRELVAYAAAKGITIIPEVDLPGHMQAALAAYPELGCTGGPYKVWERWGISEDVLCIGNEKVFTFLEDVIDELCELFPSEYFHIGGDECPKVRWHNCPKCKAKMAELGIKSDENFSAEDYLQSYVTKRMEDYLATKGRKMIGWDEILQGEISPNATVMSWRGTAGGIKAAKMGHDVVMTPNNHCYFDYCQSLDRASEPVSIGGFISVDNVYNYEPCQDMTPEEAAHILGVQANMWTEYIATPEHLEYMLLPRMAALSEVQWCAADNKDWPRFHKTLIEKIAPIYDARGYNYAKHALDPEYGEKPEQQEIAHKAVGCKAELLGAKPHPSYTLHAPDELFDGKLGESYYLSGHWIGFNSDDLDVVVKLGGKKISSVTVSTLVDKGSWIFNMISCRISVSNDGENYTELVNETYPIDAPEVADGMRDFEYTFAPVKARYLRIQAGTVKDIPSWHDGAGQPAFAFYDEIIVN